MINQDKPITKLEMLARTLHKWPDHQNEISGISRENWEAYRGTLANKPPFYLWPYDAKCLAQSFSGEWLFFSSESIHYSAGAWLHDDGQVYRSGWAGEVIGSCQETLTHRSEIPELVFHQAIRNQVLSQMPEKADDSVLDDMTVPDSVEQEFNISNMCQIRASDLALKALNHLIGNEESEFHGKESAFWFSKNPGDQPLMYFGPEAPGTLNADSISKVSDPDIVLYSHKKIHRYKPEQLLDGVFLVSKNLRYQVMIEINRYRSLQGYVACKSAPPKIDNEIVSLSDMGLTDSQIIAITCPEWPPESPLVTHAESQDDKILSVLLLSGERLTKKDFNAKREFFRQAWKASKNKSRTVTA